MTQIHGIIATYPLQVDDVPEVPTYQHVNMTHRGEGDVLSVGLHLGRKHSRGDIGFREVPCLPVKLSVSVCASGMEARRSRTSFGAIVNS